MKSLKLIEKKGEKIESILYNQDISPLQKKKKESIK